MSQEYYKMGDKKIPLEQIRRSGTVFPAPTRVRIRRKRKPAIAKKFAPNDQPHKMADWYRPQEPK